MTAQALICSGLINNAVDWCRVREQCARYVHWTVDRRSVFNACLPTGNPLKYFVRVGVPMPTAKASPQQDLFT